MSTASDGPRGCLTSLWGPRGLRGFWGENGREATALVPPGPTVPREPVWPGQHRRPRPGKWGGWSTRRAPELKGERLTTGVGPPRFL